jgi:putative transposase
MVKKLRDAETMLAAGKAIAEVVQVLEVSEQTHYRRKSKYGGMKVEEAKRLKELEVENARLKKLLAEAELDKAMLKALASGNCRASSMLAFTRGPFSQT